MTTPTNHWKLGLFVVSALLIGVAAVIYFGSRSLPKDTTTYVSYFDEAVTGLEIGSTVKFRGVNVGNVSSIEVAPNRRHVAVSYDLASGQAQRLALDNASKERPQLGTSVRAQLGSMGVTGNKYVSLDLFDNSTPADELNFTPPARYIPTHPSTLKNLEAAVTSTANRIPEVTNQLVEVLGRVNAILTSFEQQGIAKRAGNTFANVDRVLATAQTKLDQFNSAGISKEAQVTFVQLQETVGRFNRLLERVDGNGGVIANVERASLSMGDVARNASQVGSEAERTLRDVAEAAAAVRDLADALERQPDMLLKGRASRSEQ